MKIVFLARSSLYSSLYRQSCKTPHSSALRLFTTMYHAMHGMPRFHITSARYGDFSLSKITTVYCTIFKIPWVFGAVHVHVQGTVHVHVPPHVHMYRPKIPRYFYYGIPWYGTYHGTPQYFALQWYGGNKTERNGRQVGYRPGARFSKNLRKNHFFAFFLLR